MVINESALSGLEVEMEDHLGYANHAVEGRSHGNSRYGTRFKTVITEIGPVEIDGICPRPRRQFRAADCAQELAAP
jgi:hypothetical protein